MKIAQKKTCIQYWSKLHFLQADLSTTFQMYWDLILDSIIYISSWVRQSDRLQEKLKYSATITLTKTEKAELKWSCFIENLNHFVYFIQVIRKLMIYFKYVRHNFFFLFVSFKNKILLSYFKSTKQDHKMTNVIKAFHKYYSIVMQRKLVSRKFSSKSLEILHSP